MFGRAASTTLRSCATQGPRVSAGRQHLISKAKTSKHDSEVKRAKIDMKSIEQKRVVAAKLQAPPMVPPSSVQTGASSSVQAAGVPMMSTSPLASATGNETKIISSSVRFTPVGLANASEAAASRKAAKLSSKTGSVAQISTQSPSRSVPKAEGAGASGGANQGVGGTATGKVRAGAGATRAVGGRRLMGTMREHKALVTVAASVVAWGAWTYAEEETKDKWRGSLPGRGVAWLGNQWSDMTASFRFPIREKLLPDWPIPQVPPNTPCPPLLVLDLEGTLLGTVFSRKHGWRYAKRPGVDEFLKEMAMLYEIALFTDSHSTVDEMVTKLDPNGYIAYRLYRESTNFIDGKHIKDLSWLNRPLEKIVIVDDNPESFSLQPENGIRVKTFDLEKEDALEDTTLIDLAPFLRALATQNVPDFRTVLRPHVGEDCSALVNEFNSKVKAVRQQEAAAMERGFGGLVRQIGTGIKFSPGGARGGVTSKDLVGEAPPVAPPSMTEGAINKASVPIPEEKKGGLWKSFSEGTKEQERTLMRRSEAFQAAMMAKEERERSKRE